jgi:hypothetical protein
VGSETSSLGLDRLLEPLSRCIRGEAEAELLSLRADPQLQERIDALAEGCNEGKLSSEERSEYETFVKYGNFIAILQAKARARKAVEPTG